MASAILKTLGLETIASAVPTIVNSIFGNSKEKLKQAEVEKQHELLRIQERGKQELAVQENKNQHQLVQELAKVKELEIVSNERDLDRKHEMKLFETESRAVGEVRKLEIEAQDREYERKYELMKEVLEVRKAEDIRCHELKNKELELKANKGQRCHKEQLLGLEEQKEARKDREARVGKKEQNFHNREEKRMKFMFSYMLVRLLMIFFVCCLIFMLLSKLQVIEVNTQPEIWNKMIKLKGWQPDSDSQRLDSEAHLTRSDQPTLEPKRRKKNLEL